LVTDPPDTIVPHRTIYAGERFACRLTPEARPREGAELDRQPRRSWARTWARTWARLPRRPLDVDHDREARVLNANLRWIRNWSTALQYIEDAERIGVAPASTAESAGDTQP
jgi:hypothetical protein